jgi:undecaprenyl diphosphate synthase
MHLLEQFMIEQRSAILEHNIRLEMIGRRDGIPEEVLREVDKTIEMSRDNAGLVLCLAVNYGGRAELLDATQQIARRVKRGELAPEDLTEQDIADHLYTAGRPDPDLLIRTAGEMRLSNFLLWQISYAEIWVTSQPWPEFDEQQLRRAIGEFAARQRRFGGLEATD